MIKIKIFLFLPPLIVANQIIEIGSKDFLKNPSLNDNPPTNYQEYCEINIKREDKRDFILSDLTVNKIRLQLKKTIETLDSEAKDFPEDHMFKSLVNVMPYLESRITPSLHPYINREELYNLFFYLELLYMKLENLIYRIREQETVGNEYTCSYSRFELDKIIKSLKAEECDLKKIFFFSLITKSKYAAEHRRIHSETKNRLNDVNIKKNCYFCNEIIKNDDYVFSLLCGHQIHIACMEKNGLIDNCPTCKENIWNRV